MMTSSRPGWVRTSILGGTGALVVVGAAFAPVRFAFCQGRSMDPTLHDRQLVLYRPAQIRNPSELRRGDVVLLKMRGETVVKRVFALGGDTFWSFGGPLLDTPSYWLLDVGTNPAVWKRRYARFRYRANSVPAGCVYVVGDGPGSLDSRHLGAIPVSAVIGRVQAPRRLPSAVSCNVARQVDLRNPYGDVRG